MTQEEIDLTVAENERRWRSRTPAKTVSDVNASYRVTTSELIAWGNEHGIKVDRMDENFQSATIQMYFRLRREFPQEQWDIINSATKEFCKRHRITIPKIKGQRC